ncbi:hypothetical protein MMC25_004431 [Agyrium rufum]|nr:hypothetical protein [Agyrium rufum]
MPMTDERLRPLPVSQQDKGRVPPNLSQNSTFDAISSHTRAEILGKDADISTLSQQVTSLAERIPKDGDIDADLRQELRDATQKLNLALETPGDTVQRIAYLPLQTTVVRMALELNVLHELVEAGIEGRSVDDLSRVTGAEAFLLARMLRYLAAIDVVKQLDHDQYAATSITMALDIPVLAAGVKHNYDFVCPIFMKLPEFLAKHDWKSPTETLDSPLQYTYNTKLGGYAWIAERNEMFTNFNIWMKGQRKGRADWLDFYDFEKEILAGYIDEPNGVLMVDVGGGMGYELTSLKKKFPQIKGRLILQDLKETVAQAVEAAAPPQAFEPMVHDFFQPQPVKGARIYYFRQVIQNWQDAKCLQIFRHTIAAMKKGYSRIIINEMVVPDIGAGVHQSNVDFTMMSCLSAMERTENDWHNLLGSVGLRVLNIWTLNDRTESIIEAVPQ